jgi:hypothetical protein
LLRRAELCLGQIEPEPEHDDLALPVWQGRQRGDDRGALAMLAGRIRPAGSGGESR